MLLKVFANTSMFFMFQFEDGNYEWAIPLIVSNFIMILLMFFFNEIPFAARDCISTTNRKNRSILTKSSDESSFYFQRTEWCSEFDDASRRTNG